MERESAPGWERPGHSLMHFGLSDVDRRRGYTFPVTSRRAREGRRTVSSLGEGREPPRDRRGVDPMRKFLTTGRRRYALPSLVIGILALTACVPEDVQAPFLNVKSHDFGSVPLGSSSAPFQFTVTNPLVGFSHVSLHTSVGEPFSVIMTRAEEDHSEEATRALSR